MMPKFNVPATPNRIREFRELLGLTQHQLADATGIARGTLARLDCNPHAQPSLPVALKLAQAFNVPVAELITPGP